MAGLHYLVVLIIISLNSGGDAAKVISMDSDDVDTKYNLIEGLSNQQSFGELHVLLNTYTHSQTKDCVKVLTIQLTEEFYLDAILVSCDINPPFLESAGLVNIADVVYVSAQKGSAAWAVYRVGDMCHQRTYTDQNWTPLDELLDLKLKRDLCDSVLQARVPMAGGTVPAPVDEKLPDFDNTQGKIFIVGDTLLEQYNVADVEDKEMDGPSMKIIVTRLTHSKNGQCMDVVYVDMKESEDMLDCVQITCNDQATFVKAKGMIVYGGLVYVRDHPEDAVWVVFRLNNKCDLKIYTDKQKQLVEPKGRTLSLAQCKTVVETQRIDHLPQILTNLKIAPTNKRPFSEELADVQKLITQQDSASSPRLLTPSSGPLIQQPTASPPPSPPLAPQPLDTSKTDSIPPATLVNTASQPVLSRPPLPNKLVSSSSTIQPSQPSNPQVAQPISSPFPISPPQNIQLPSPSTTTMPPQIIQPSAAPPSVYIVYSPPPPPPPPSPGIFGGFANKIGGYFNNKFGSPPTPATTPSTPAALTSTPSVPTTTTLTPTAPTTITSLPAAAAASGTVLTPVALPVSSVPIAPPQPPPAPAPAPAPPPKKPWWHFF